VEPGNEFVGHLKQQTPVGPCRSLQLLVSLRG
jgi:hypothetical protein